MIMKEVQGTHTTYSTVPWRFIDHSNRWLITERNNFVRQHGSDYKIETGINFSIILSSACFIEGVFEDGLGFTIDFRPRGVDVNLKIFLADLRNRASREMKLENYSLLFKALFNKKIHELVQPNIYEDVFMLFRFRNKLAHGRAFHTHSTHDAGFFWDADDKVGRDLEVFLKKRGLIEKGSTEIKPIEFFNSNVADFFWKSSLDFVDQLSKTLLSMGHDKFHSILQ